MLNYDVIKCPLCYGELLIEKIELNALPVIKKMDNILKAIYFLCVE
jgi:hypothetical protein